MCRVHRKGVGWGCMGGEEGVESVHILAGGWEGERLELGEPTSLGTSLRPGFRVLGNRTLSRGCFWTPWLLDIAEGSSRRDLGRWLEVGHGVTPLLQGPVGEDHPCGSLYPSRHAGDPGDIWGTDEGA